VTFYLAETTAGLRKSDKLLSIVNILDKRQSPQFTVFPNPTKDIIQLTSEEVRLDQILRAELRNALGEKIFAGSATIEELNKQLSKAVQENGKGVFTLKIVVDDEISVLRILKI
jgi:hypothetical protein